MLQTFFPALRSGRSAPEGRCGTRFRMIRFCPYRALQGMGGITRVPLRCCAAATSQLRLPWAMRFCPFRAIRCRKRGCYGLLPFQGDSLPQERVLCAFALLGRFAAARGGAMGFCLVGRCKRCRIPIHVIAEVELAILKSSLKRRSSTNIRAGDADGLLGVILHTTAYVCNEYATRLSES